MENLTAIIEAANNGDAMSQYKLGRAYENGDGVEKNIDTAKSWYQKSADNGYKNAEMKLKLLSNVETTATAEPEEVTRQAYSAPPAPEVVGYNNSNNIFNKVGFEQDSYQYKSKIVAAVLALFLGYYGIHDFYLGYKKNGIIKLVLTLTMIGSIVSGIWSLIDFIKIIGNGKFDSNGQPLK